jgi:hypothetical protein
MTGVEEGAALAAAGGGAAATYGGLTAAQLAALALSVGGTGASIYGQQQQANQRRDIANQQLQRTAKAQEETDAKIATEGQQYAPDARTDALKDQQAQTFAQETKDVGTAPTIIEGAGDGGNVSSDYLSAKADTALAEGNRLTALARELSKTRAPSQLNATEALRRANLSSDLGSIWGADKREANAATLDAQNVAEPWYGSLGKLASAAGSAYLASGAGAATPSAVDGAGGIGLQEGGYPASITGEAPYAPPRAGPSVFGRVGAGQIRFGR